MGLISWFFGKAEKTVEKSYADVQRARFDSIVRLIQLLDKLGVPIRGVTPSLVLGLSRGVTYKTQRRMGSERKPQA